MIHLLRVYKLAKKCRAQVNNYFLNENQGKNFPPVCRVNLVRWQFRRFGSHNVHFQVLFEGIVFCKCVWMGSVVELIFDVCVEALSIKSYLSFK